jgi:hypothetical protein
MNEGQPSQRQQDIFYFFLKKTVRLKLFPSLRKRVAEAKSLMPHQRGARYQSSKRFSQTNKYHQHQQQNWNTHTKKHIKKQRTDTSSRQHNKKTMSDSVSLRAGKYQETAYGDT